MKTLVTGSAGFIGHQLVKALLDEGHEVIGCDNFLTGDRARVIEHPNYKLLDCPVQSLEYEAINKDIPLEFDIIFHLAALPRVPVSFERPSDSIGNNVMSTLAALELARKCGAAFVYSSSSSVYGTQKEFPFKETMETKPESPYALSKLMGEELCEQYKTAFGVRSASLRYFNVYGPGMTVGGYATAIRTFIDQRKEGKPLTVTGDGTQERDFTHVSDVVHANILAGKALLARGMAVTGPYNIGAGSPVCVNDIAGMIGGNVEYIEARREPKKTHADHTRAKNILGWEPLVSFNKGLNDLIATEL